MRIAVAREGNQVSEHFGHCECFGLYDVEDGKILMEAIIESPPHQPGLLPAFLKEKGVNVVISGGMGRKALELFEAVGIKTITGINGSAQGAVEAFLKGSLVGTGAVCNHHGDHDCEHQ